MNQFIEYYVFYMLVAFTVIGLVNPPKNLKDLGYIAFDALYFPYFVMLGVVVIYRKIRATFKSNR